MGGQDLENATGPKGILGRSKGPGFVEIRPKFPKSHEQEEAAAAAQYDPDDYLRVERPPTAEELKERDLRRNLDSQEGQN